MQHCDQLYIVDFFDKRNSLGGKVDQLHTHKKCHKETENQSYREPFRTDLQLTGVDCDNAEREFVRL